MVGRSVTARPWAPCSFRTPLLSITCVKRSVADAPERNQFAWSFRLVRAGYDRRQGGHGLLHQGHGLGRLGRVDARKGPIRSSSHGKVPVSGLTELPDDARKWERRRPGSAMSGSTTWTRPPTGSRASVGPCMSRRRTSSDISRFSSLHRSANREARVVQVAQTRPAAACRAGCAGPRRLARTARRRLGAGMGFLRRAFWLAKRGRRQQRDGARISSSRPEGR